MSIRIAEIKDPRLRQRITDALGVSTPHPEASKSTMVTREAGKATPRIKQHHGAKMNKLETEWFNLIKDRYPNYPPVRPQAKTYVLANGVRYTPDLSCSLWSGFPFGEGAKETCWEVKGPKAWDDALVKLKVAAHEWPEVRWVLVWKENGQWKEQTVLP